MMNTKPLTAKQFRIADFIFSTVSKVGYPPTVREIGEQFGIASPNGVMCHLRALEKKGVIERIPHKSRAIRMVSVNAAFPLLPYLGEVG